MKNLSPFLRVAILTKILLKETLLESLCSEAD